MRDYDKVISALKTDLASRLPTTFHGSSFSTAQADAEGWSSDSVAAALQVTALYKKLAPNGQSQKAIAATLNKFSLANNNLRFVPPHEGDSESMLYQMELFREFLWRDLDLKLDGSDLDIEFFQNHFASGPGASVQANSRNFYTKLFDSNHSCTSPYVLALFRAAISRSETWTRAYAHWSKNFQPVIVSGNTLFTVPKNSEVSRTCCTEPLLNMLLQKAIGSYIEIKLKRLGISLDTRPEINRDFACQGSISGSYGTTDLSSASDSITIGLCDWAIPPTFNKWLRVTRSPNVRYPNGQEEPLGMIGTMGNGFTFPLQTLIFASAIRAVYEAKGLQAFFSGPKANASVFGDDIIVRKDCFHAVNVLLERLAFTVNESKSFNSGSFRESCGYDFWNGRNVRPVFIETLETPSDVYSAFNRLARWSAENRIPLGRTLTCLKGMASFMPIPFSWADDSGFKVPIAHAPKRFNGSYWRKFNFIEPISTVQPVPVGANDAKALKYKDYNPYGWELCFIGGYARNPGGTFLTSTGLETANTRKDDGINRRPFQGEVLPRRRRTGAIPFWDWFGEQELGRFGRSSFQYWEVLVAHIF